MTTYTHTGDIRTRNDSDTQNVVTTDTVSVTINLFNNDKSNKKVRKRRLGVFME